MEECVPTPEEPVGPWVLGVAPFVFPEEDEETGVDNGVLGELYLVLVPGRDGTVSGRSIFIMLIFL